jgi:ankyrin repeat protein
MSAHDPSDRRPHRDLPTRPDLNQYKKQAKDLLAAYRNGDADARRRLRAAAGGARRATSIVLADAQFVLAREHGFENWPAFAKHLGRLAAERAAGDVTDPVAAFVDAATVPRHDHASGTLDYAEAILARFPDLAHRSICVAALLADEDAVRAELARHAGTASAPVGPLGWDPLTYLCFSRYLRLDEKRSQAFVRTARALLEAGARAQTGWVELIDHPNPRPVLESAIYGAAGIARHADLTRLLLEHGADPNDEETPYHVPETRDNTVMRVLLDSGTLTADSLATMLLRKMDWHDLEGARMLLAYGVDPNRPTRWGYTALHQAVRRDNAVETIELLLEHGADPSIADEREHRSATALAARHGRRDALALLMAHDSVPLADADRVIAACALGDRQTVDAMLSAEPALGSGLLAEGPTLLAEFAGSGNADGVRILLDCGVSAAARSDGDAYFGLTTGSTALHVAAWRAHPDVVAELIARGAPVNARDGKGRTPLMLAVKACVDSFWTERRSPASVRALLDAGASLDGVEFPSGYDEVDALLRDRVVPGGMKERG